MTVKPATLALIEEWKTKCMDLSNQTNDGLVSVMLRTFDALCIIGNGCDSNRIRRALDSLECERSLCLRTENTSENTEKDKLLRTTMYGLIQSFHGLLADITTLKDSISVEIQTDEKSFLLPLEPVISLISGPRNNESKDVPMEKGTLQITRKTVEEIKEEEVMNDEMDFLMNDGLFDMNNSNNDVPSNAIQDQPITRIVTKVTSEGQKEPKKEPVDPAPVISNHKQTTISEDMAAYYAIPEDEVDNFEINTGLDDLAPELDSSLNGSSLEDENMNEPDGTFPEECEPIMEERDSMDDEEMMNEKDVINELSQNQIQNQGRKSTRRVNRPVKYNSMENSDEEEVEVEPTMKKTRLDSDEKSGKESTQVKCVLCETYPKSAHDYANHLDRVHKSTLNANGIYLICSCAEVIRSRKADYQNHHKCLGFTVHKKENEVHISPQCILCETYPKTAHGYAYHLYQVHKSNLKANRAYLRCSCGLEVRSHFHNPDHIRECDALRFTLHKFEDDIHTTPKCILCETFPKTSQGYANHIFRAHKSTLNANGIHLLCSCGFKITSTKGSWKHSKECNEPQFSVHKDTEE